MCILAIAWQAHPRWHLVVAGNRDERQDRAATRLDRWQAPSHVIAGKDLQSGGTWLGVSEQGRFGVITNVRNPDGPRADRASRGALVTDFLSGEGRYADPERADPSEFNPFNFIMVDRDRAQFLSNRSRPTRSPLAKGVHGLSNGALDEPWAKTVELTAALRAWIDTGAERPEALLDVLSLESPAAFVGVSTRSDSLPEPALTPIFIRNPVYGTRCSTVVAIDNQGCGLIIERSFAPDGGRSGETSLSFSWPQ